MNRTHETECERIQTWIDAALRGRLAESERGRFEAHVSTCTACAAAYEDAQTVHRLFADLDAPKCPDSVVDRIHAAVDAEAEPAVMPASEVGWMERLRRVLTHPVPARIAVGALSAAAVVLLALIIGPPGDGEPGGDLVNRTTADGDVAESMAIELDLVQAQKAAGDARLAFSIVMEAMGRSARLAGKGIREHVTAPTADGVRRGLLGDPHGESSETGETDSPSKSLIPFTDRPGSHTVDPLFERNRT